MSTMFRLASRCLALAVLWLALPVFADSPPPVPPADAQIAAAVLALPEALRDGVTVLGYDAGGNQVTLRDGKGFVCLADDPAKPRFEVACYQAPLDPFMARGRALRAEGKDRDAVQAARRAEIAAGTLTWIDAPSTLYVLSAASGEIDPDTGTVRDGLPRWVIYVPYATEATIGLAPRPPSPGAPWLMAAGEPWAHIMIIPPPPSSDGE